MPAHGRSCGRTVCAMPRGQPDRSVACPRSGESETRDVSGDPVTESSSAPTKKAAPAKKTTAKKAAPAKKATAKKATPAKKATAKKATPAKKSTAKKAPPAKKTATKKTSAEKTLRLRSAKKRALDAPRSKFF